MQYRSIHRPEQTPAPGIPHSAGSSIHDCNTNTKQTLVENFKIAGLVRNLKLAGHAQLLQSGAGGRAISTGLPSCGIEECEDADLLELKACG